MFRETTDLRIVSPSDATRYEVSDRGQIELAQRIAAELHMGKSRRRVSLDWSKVPLGGCICKW